MSDLSEVSPWSVQDPALGTRYTFLGVEISWRLLLLEVCVVRVKCWKDLIGSAGRLAGPSPLSLLPSNVYVVPPVNLAGF